MLLLLDEFGPVLRGERALIETQLVVMPLVEVARRDSELGDVVHGGDVQRSFSGELELG